MPKSQHSDRGSARTQPSALSGAEPRTQPRHRLNSPLRVRRHEHVYYVFAQAKGATDAIAVGKVEQDYLRRVVLREHDKPGGIAPGLIAQTVRFCLDNGYHVVLEGILKAALYADMLRASALPTLDGPRSSTWT